MSIPALRFEQLSQSYKNRPVLQGIDLEIGAGECLGLVGVNGAGKTSLIKCLLDFIPLSGGRIAIAGRSHRDPLARSPLTYLPERFMPPAHLNGGDFLRYLLRLHGLPYRREAVLACLAELELERAALSAPVHDHSKGMSQKLGLAACLLSGKPILVLDEPMSGLDPKARAVLKARLAKRCADGATILLSSHSLSDVEALCHRVAILHEGRLRFVGSPAACREAYGAATLDDAFLRCIDRVAC